MKEIIILFLKLGALGFGGPIALIGYMQQECIQKRSWLSGSEFSKIVAVSKLFPGPLATLVAIQIGKRRAGLRGGIAAGVCLLLPAFLMILILAKTMKTLDRYSFLNPLWLGLTLASLVVATLATANLTRPLFQKITPSLSRSGLASILVISMILTFLFPKAEPLFIIGAGLLGLIWEKLKQAPLVREVGSVALLMLLFIHCFRASIFTFGSGIAIIPVLKSVFIDEFHFVSNQDFLRGMMLGQITPGPILLVSTYLGYVAAGLMGALMSTLGCYLPSFLLGLVIIPKIENRVLESEKLRAFFLWLLPAVCGAIFGSLARLSLFSIIVNNSIIWNRAGFTVALLFITFRFKPSVGKVFFIGAAASYLILRGV